MAQRISGFERRDADLYETPEWVIDALVEHVNLRDATIWEPACGTGKMVRALAAHGAQVIATDVNDFGFAAQVEMLDFATHGPTPQICAVDGIVTNPPYGQRGALATAFIAKAVEYVAAGDIEFAAMLLPVDFDSAKTRAHLFDECPFFAGRIALRRRIKWFDHPTGASNPSQNHAWFLWERPARIWRLGRLLAYAPSQPRSDEQ